jgi:hypothetical protein
VLLFRGFVTADPTPTYYALRIGARTHETTWWEAAHRAGDTAPLTIRSILAGRSRVEVTAAEAREALEWARTLEGWDAAPDPPLWVYPVEPS